MPAKKASSKFGPRKKYSLARTMIGITPQVAPTTGTAASVSVDVVAAAAVQGKRKVKNFDITLGLPGPIAGQAQTACFYYALVYVPAGQLNANSINLTQGAEFYSPASNVIAAGIYDAHEGTGFRIRTRLASNNI